MSPAMASLAWGTKKPNLVVPAARQACGFPVLSGQLCTTCWKPLAQHASPDSSKNSVLSSEMSSPFMHVCKCMYARCTHTDKHYLLHYLMRRIKFPLGRGQSFILLHVSAA